jgi:hypothetical protein
MVDISSRTELQDAIQILKAEQAVKLKLIKEEFHFTYESLRPVNLIKSRLKDITTSPNLVRNIVVIFIGLYTVYLSQKAITGKSGNKLRKFFGYFLKYGITNFVAQNPLLLKRFGQFVSQHTFQKGK